jgi:hypothetical protein
MLSEEVTFQEVEQEDDSLADQQSIVQVGRGASEIVALTASILPLLKG